MNLIDIVNNPEIAGSVEKKLKKGGDSAKIPTGRIERKITKMGKRTESAPKKSRQELMEENDDLREKVEELQEKLERILEKMETTNQQKEITGKREKKVSDNISNSDNMLANAEAYNIRECMDTEAPSDAENANGDELSDFVEVVRRKNRQKRNKPEIRHIEMEGSSQQHKTSVVNTPPAIIVKEDPKTLTEILKSGIEPSVAKNSFRTPKPTAARLGFSKSVPLEAA
ncbi:unnamed protein product [Phyllotreta striolata]|uniref:Uncharacterized protein n=1 Tax=Phyllotreta striolata TaxID=444603 RepID=A0A9P0E042_PHYSR|nr:unnamed protein product [Phyllotreta striolata]